MDTEQQSQKNTQHTLQDFVNEIMDAYTVRVKVIEGIIHDTHAMMNAFRIQRETMAQELREVLAHNEHLRKKDFNEMMRGIIARQHERENEVRNLLDTFRNEEEIMVQKLKELLAKGKTLRIKHFKKMLVEIKEEQEHRIEGVNQLVGVELENMRKEVQTMLAKFKEERQSVAHAWHEALTLFHKKAISV